MLRVIKNIFKPEKIVLSDGQEIQPPKSIVPYIIIGLVIAVVIAADVTGFSLSTVIERGDQFFVILKGMVPPDFSYAKSVLPPLIDTIKMSVLGSMIGCFIAIPFAILSSVNINKSKLVLNLVRLVLSITRTLPTLIIALVATYIFGLGTFAGTVAITIFTFGLVVKMLYEKIGWREYDKLGMILIMLFITVIIIENVSKYIRERLG